jgi:large subunit ribosomal protein L22
LAGCSAAANAKHNYGLDKKKTNHEVFADEGPKLKRIRPRAQGRVKNLKPTCHIKMSN